MRKVKFKKISPEQPAKEGLFHLWGQEVIVTSKGNASYTVGIVEDESGMIHQIHPELIQFTDKPKF